MINLNDKPTESLATEFNALFVKPNESHAKRQAKKVKDNPLVIKNALLYVAYADDQKAKAKKDKNKAFKIALGDYGYLTDREHTTTKNELSAVRWLIKQELQFLSDADFVEFINNLSGNAASVYGIRQELEKTLAAEKPKNPSGDNGDGDNGDGDDSDNEETKTETIAPVLSKAEIIEQEFSAMLTRLMAQGVSSADFWDASLNESMEKISEKAQADFVKQSNAA